jgi:predicted TIM-barrel fold metal-dependent hydrolase
MADPLYYSCDSHVVEGPEVFEGLVDQFGERAPRVVSDPPGREGKYLVWPSQGLPLPIGRFGIAGANLDLPETKERIKQGWDGINPGVKDPVARLTEQAEDGILGEVMYPSINMFTFSIDDREVVHEVFRRHNDWIVDYCSHSPDRLIGVGCLPLPDVEDALTEMERVVKRGVRGLAIPCTAPPNKPYSDPSYEPFWAAAEEMGIPLTMHIFCGSEWGMSLPGHWNGVTSYAMASAGIAWTIESLITGGVLARHPNLQFVCAEWETGWTAHWLERLDHAAYRVPREISPDMKDKPSEYFRRNFHVTFEDDEIGILTRHRIGVDRMLWGNDYPHHDSIWPNSRQVIDHIMQDVPENEVKAMTWDNVMRLYDLDEAKVRAAAGV